MSKAAVYKMPYLNTHMPYIYTLTIQKRLMGLDSQLELVLFHAQGFVTAYQTISLGVLSSIERRDTSRM